MSQATTEGIIADLGFREEMQQLREILERWIGGANQEIRPLLEWQFITNSKYFRPLTVFSTHRAITDEPIPNRLIYSAAVLEMVHNMTLIVDDIVDTAGTLGQVADAIRRAGAREVLASSSHAVLSGRALEKIEASPLSKLIVTDSIPLSDEKKRSRKIVVLSIAELMRKAIRNIHEEASVTSLFV